MEFAEKLEVNDRKHKDMIESNKVQNEEVLALKHKFARKVEECKQLQQQVSPVNMCERPTLVVSPTIGCGFKERQRRRCFATLVIDSNLS